MVKILVERVFEIMVTNELKLKYSRLKTIKWCIIVKTEINKNALLNEVALKLKSK